MQTVPPTWQHSSHFLFIGQQHVTGQFSVSVFGVKLTNHSWHASDFCFRGLRILTLINVYNRSRCWQVNKTGEKTHRDQIAWVVPPWAENKTSVNVHHQSISFKASVLIISQYHIWSGSKAASDFHDEAWNQMTVIKYQLKWQKTREMMAQR